MKMRKRGVTDGVGPRVRAARESAGFTLAELGKRVGLSQPTLSKIENGQVLQSSYLQHIAKVLDVDPEWLLRGEVSAKRVRPEAEDIANMVSALPEDYRLMIQNIVIAVVKSYQANSERSILSA
jgi:transcriptional regulator with XRE-family HTH domain